MAKSTTKASGKKDTTKKPEDKGPSKREIARKEKEEAAAKARQAKIDSGDLLVGKNTEFEKVTKDTKSLKRAEGILKALDGAKEPVFVKEMSEKLGAYYEEVLPALTMLEALGKVQRYEASLGGRGRRQVAYMLV